MLFVACIAGFAAWGCGEMTNGFFRPSEESSARRFDFGALNRELRIAGTRNAAVSYGLLGGLLGLALGLSAAPWKGPAARSLGPGLLGLIAGAAGGVAGSYLVIPIHFEYKDPSGTDMLQSARAHGVIWGLAGLGAGLAVGLSGPHPGRPIAVRSALGGLIGALLGTVVYELVGGLAFPLDRTTDAVAASTSTRLIACISVAIGTALGILAFRPPAPAPPEVPQAESVP
ncbi:hypothetical protein [Paludisphaera mucosa]|uniref:Uncharacterized protein n=1 Tax=Paludisphaera mucosa TaxID=3030827 RepID=A0ABT6FJC0_9BACT|nr:hypothetical protein [Paludisphaera mucosa]MDG3007672.1 hypothetical protein [Paludisphaera mucosa]